MCTRQFSISLFLYHLPSVIELAYFDTWRRGEFPAALSGASIWEARCKEQCWRKAIYNPTIMLPSLPYSTPSTEVLLRDKEVQQIWGENRRQLLESSRSCWDVFSTAVENPVFLTLQVRLCCLFLPFQNNHGKLKLQDNMPSCYSSSPNQHEFSMNLARRVWPSHIDKRKTISKETVYCAALTEAAFQHCYLILNTNICPC